MISTQALVTAILGETGAGKTTLVRILLALMKPNKGSVEIYNEKRKQRVDTAHACTTFVYVPSR